MSADNDPPEGPGGAIPTFVSGTPDDEHPEAIFRSIFELGNIGIAVTSLERGWARVNPRLCQMLGYSEQELRERSWMEMTHPDDLAADLAQYERMLGGELDAYELDKRFIKSDGTVVHAHLTLSCSRAADGEARYIIASIQDVSDRFETARQLERRVALESTIAEISSLFVGLVELDEAIAVALERLARFSDASRSYVFRFRDGRTVMDNTHEWCAPGVEPQIDHLQGIACDAIPWWMEQVTQDRVIHLDTLDDLPVEAVTEREILSSQGIRSLLVLPLQMEGDLAGFIGFDNVRGPSQWSEPDITVLRMFAERLGGALERQAVDDALRTSQQRLRQVVDLVPLMVFAKDQEGRHFLANRAMADFYGVEIRDLIGKTDFDLIASPEQAQRFREEDVAVIEGGTALYTGEATATDAQGRVRTVETTKIPFAFSGMSSPAILGVAVDVTDRRIEEAAKLELERRLLDAQKLESLGVLAGGIAHDFNNLLAIIIGNLELVTQGVAPDSAEHDRAIQALLAGQRATDLTRQMLAYSGRGRFVVEPLDLRDLVQENADLFKSAIPKRVHLDVELGPESCSVAGDRGQLQQIVMNLITNASEAIDDDGGHVKLSVGVTECDEECLADSRVEERPPPGRFAFVEVRDTGSGMDERTLRQIFEPFFTTKFAGRGLGMSGVLGIVKGHQGAIFVRSALGEGTTIRVSFPLLADAVPSAGTTLASERAGFTEAPLSGTVLVADDEPQVRRLAAEFLESLGLGVLEAENGAEAVELFGEHGDDLVCVLLDFSMPRMDGASAFREMARIRSDVPVILCSGYDDRESTAQLMSDGLAGFVQKPFRLRDLESRIREVLARTERGDHP